MDLEFTGERVVPGKVDLGLWSEHVVRYRFASRFVAGRRVLDLGCGTGYGAEILAQGGCRSLIGFDLALEALRYAGTHYRHASSGLVAGDAADLPFAQASLDCVVCFELIEHLRDPPAMLREVRRVLDPRGVFVVSTPNRRTYRDERPEAANPFHVEEFYRQDLEAALGKCFGSVALYGQQITEGARIEILSDDGAARDGADGQKVETLPGVASGEPDFFLAVCRPAAAGEAAAAGAPAVSSVFYALPTNLLRDLRRVARDAQQDLDEKRAWSQQLDGELGSLRQRLSALQGELEERTAWARGLDAEVERFTGVVRDLQAELERIQNELQERTRWAQQLDEEASRRGRALAELQEELESRTRWARDLEREIAHRDGIVRRLQQDLESAAAQIRERSWIRRLGGEGSRVRDLQEALERAETLFEERTRWALGLEEELERHRAVVTELREELESRTAWARDLEREVSRRDEVIVELGEELESRTAWARDLEGEIRRRDEVIVEQREELESRTRWAREMEAELEARRAPGGRTHSEPEGRLSERETRPAESAGSRPGGQDQSWDVP